MTHALAPGLSYCEVGDHIILMDLKRDRYFGVSARQAAAMRSLSSQASPASEPEVLKGLVRQGILVETTGGDLLRPCRHQTARSSLLEDHHGRAAANLIDLIEVGFLVTAVWLSLRLFHCSRVIAARRRKRRSTGGDARAATLRFLAMRRLIPIKPVCLLDAIALAAFVERRGGRADVVIGVGLHPFEAHAWAQSDDCLLNETLHRATMLTPILVA